MNADTFNSDSSCCPICHRAGAVQPPKLITGLLTCPHCRARLVVSWSGHYVRDPFTLKCLATGQMLRRESRPLARIRRDFTTIAHPLVLLLLSAAVVAGSVLVVTQTHPLGQQTPETTPTLKLDADSREQP